jgi:hypothetical protein
MTCPSQKRVLGRPAPRVSCRSGRCGPNSLQLHLVTMEQVFGRPRQYLPAQPPGDAVPVPDSADNHEALHMYSLPGIVMYVRNALLRHER